MAELVIEVLQQNEEHHAEVSEKARAHTHTISKVDNCNYRKALWETLIQYTFFFFFKTDDTQTTEPTMQRKNCVMYTFE